MESLKDTDSAKMFLLDMQQACRVCLSKENNMNMSDLAYENESMLEIFTRCTTVSLEPNGDLTTYLCGKCINFLMQVQDFRLRALKSNSELLYLKELAEKRVEVQPSLPIVIDDDEDIKSEAQSEENTDSSVEQEKTIYATLQNVVPNFVVTTTGFENNLVHTPEPMCLVYEDDENYYVENRQNADGTEVVDKENILLKFETEEISSTPINTALNQVVNERDKTKNTGLKKMQIVQVCKICRQVFTSVRELNKHFNRLHKRDIVVIKHEQV